MIEIRPFPPTETEAVVALWDTCDLIRPWNDPRTDIERKLRVGPELFLVAVEEDLVLVGSVMAGYEGHRGWINYLAVDPSYRRQGLGRRLMMRPKASSPNEAVRRSTCRSARRTPT